MIGRTVDPITFEVVRHRLTMIGEEQAAALRAVSGSPVVTEANDFNTGIFMADGAMVNMGLHVTIHADCISLVIRHILTECKDNPGIGKDDMFLNNDPYKGALHQSDFSLVAPIFYRGDLVAWVGTTAHQLDIGGMIFGSWCPHATEIQQEGMLIPLVKFIEGGRLRKDIWNLILSMSRLPFILGLDLKAMIASNNVAKKRLLYLIDRYGLETVLAVMEEMIHYSEEKLRARLRELPDGIFRAVDYIDHDGHQNKLYQFNLTMTKEGDSLTFDYSGSASQAPGFINCTESGLKGGVFTALLPILAYDIPWNEGLKRPLKIIAPKGSICNATPPAPTGAATIAAAWLVANTAVRTLSSLVGCCDHFRRESQAICSGGFSVLNMAGLNQYQEPFGSMLMDPMASGEGAYSFRDGADAHGCLMLPVPNIANVETNENFIPILYLYRKIVPDSCGPGKFRGGCSGGVAFIIHDVEGSNGLLVAHGVEVPNATGICGGFPGSCIVHKLLKGSNIRDLINEGRCPQDIEELEGEPLTLGAKPGLINFGPDDLFHYTWQGGGGYGDPLEREPGWVLEDVKQGLVSREAASGIYGVVIDPEILAFNPEKTQKLREDKRFQRLRSGSNKIPNRQSQEKALKPIIQLLRMGEYLYLGETIEGQKIIHCLCGQYLGSAAENWKNYALLRLVPPDSISPLLTLHRELELREFICPSCGRLLSTEVAPRGNPPLWEVQLDWVWLFSVRNPLIMVAEGFSLPLLET